MEQLPELAAGQPPWVVVIVAVLLVAGGIGAALVKRGKDDDEPATPALETAGHGTVAATGDAALMVALNHLADTARSERAEAEEARRETAALRARVEEQAGEMMTLQRRLTSVQADLDACERDRRAGWSR